MDYMSDSTFFENLGAILTYVDKLITDPDQSDRLRARLLAVYEHAAGKQGELIAEVMQTAFGPIVVARTAVEDSAEKMRQDSRRNIEPLNEDPAGRIHIASRRAQFRLRTVDLAAWISDGLRKKVVKPGYTVRRVSSDN
jgi:hypothetical protein